MRLDELSGLSFNYDGVGASGNRTWPPGYHTMAVRRRIGTGRAAFDRAADGLMHWQVQDIAGVSLSTSVERIAVGAESLARLGFGPLAVPAPCRVVWTVEKPDRVGYAYGTLHGHPAAGEESFVVTLEDEAVFFEVSAFSRPATRLARLGGPLTRVMQRFVATRYVARLQRVST